MPKLNIWSKLFASIFTLGGVIVGAFLMQNLDRKVSMLGVTRELKKVENNEKDKYSSHFPPLQQKDNCQSVFDIYEGEGTEIFIGCSKGTNLNGKPENKVEAVYRIS